MAGTRQSLAFCGCRAGNFDIKHPAACIEATGQTNMMRLLVCPAVRALHDVPRRQLMMLAAEALPRTCDSLLR